MSDKIFVLATRNRGKIKDLIVLISGFDINTNRLYYLRPNPILEEDWRTFEENAYRNVFFIAKSPGVSTPACDSGLGDKASLLG
jgi:inosine/xanthosine triphosphate pyrophosphatase family protein